MVVDAVQNTLLDQASQALLAATATLHPSAQLQPMVTTPFSFSYHPVYPHHTFSYLG